MSTYAHAIVFEKEAQAMATKRQRALLSLERKRAQALAAKYHDLAKHLLISLHLHASASSS